MRRVWAGESVSRKQPEIPRYQIEEAIFQWMIGPRSERNREIMYDLLFRGLTVEQTAELHDMSDRQIKNIYKQSWNLILKHIPG